MWFFGIAIVPPATKQLKLQEGSIKNLKNMRNQNLSLLSSIVKGGKTMIAPGRKNVKKAKPGHCGRCGEKFTKKNPPTSEATEGIGKICKKCTDKDFGK
jgi:hypothetical protein